MKKTILFSVLAAAVLSAACERVPGSSIFSGPAGKLSAEIMLDGAPPTRAADSGIDVLGSEATVNKVDLFIFSASAGKDGLLARHFAGTTLTDPQWANVTLPVGSYDVYAVVNGLEDYSTVLKKSDLLGYDYDISLFNGRSADFLMAGSTSASVEISENETTPASLVVSRLVARVVVRSVTDNLPAALPWTLEGMYLQNVPALAGLDGAVRSTKFYNPDAHVSENYADHDDVDITNADAPDVTAAPAPVAALYTYENTSAGKIGTYKDADVYGSLLQPVLTVYGIVGSFGRKYYNIPLNGSVDGGLLRNHTYDVKLTINNIGTDTPHEDLLEGAAALAITAAEWEPGDSFNKEM